MGIFNSFKSLVKAGVDTVLLPIDVVKDVVTLGGVVTDERSAIAERLDRVLDDLQDAYDEIDDD